MSAEPKPDFELLESWRAGDERAGRELFARHFDSIYRFFRSKVDDAAEDLTQQTFLGCVKGKDRYRGDASFRTYLYTIARNRLYTHIRDRQRRDAVLEVGQQSVADLGLGTATAHIAAREEQKLLLTAMRHLPLEMQVALELHYWEGLSVREIAAVIDTPEGTIKRRLQRARQRLDELIVELASSDELRRSTQANFDDWAKALRDDLLPTPADEDR
ncbi:RNA polymerase sigma-70 factor [Enhygromyxa salina]|uniref:RNA polymerase sigma-70 factor n=1 Tax=Enhygromyxa salina TaxID=215803 RepID=A0A0C2CZP2_9BACT|nr:RNA polymerase sigma factor [Enhygromyxa salina]KIG16451.1 RNA polymerase sigma-70 factor [Enhygromyxa salina]